MIIKYLYTYTAAAGAISFNTNDIRGIVRRTLIVPATLTTSYDITITDDNLMVVYAQNGVVGKLNDLTEQSFRGIYTFALSNVSANEEFNIQIEYIEIPS